MEVPIRVILLVFIIQSSNCQEERNLTSAEIEDIFSSFLDAGNTTTTTTTTEAGPSQPIQGRTPEGQPCECVLYYQCNNNSIITNGETLIDIRQDNRECANYMHVCCSLPMVDHDKKPVPRVPNDPPEDSTTTCGIRNANGVTALRILTPDSYTSQFAEFPWMVAIYRMEALKGIPSTENSVYQCGGSLIHPQVVLTAAHCIAGRSPARNKRLKIRAGEWDMQMVDEDYEHQERFVERKIVHPKYNPSTHFNDVALLILESPVETMNHIDATCLPPKNHVALDTSDCFVTGWGTDKHGKGGQYSGILKKLELPVVPKMECESALKKTKLTQRFVLHPGFMCAGGQAGQDACKGDGGSPMVCPIAGLIGRYQQVGIVSWGIGCGTEGIPGIYTDVAVYRDWIDDHMTNAGFGTSTYLP